PAVEHHAVHRAVAGNGEVREQVIGRRVARVLHRRDDRHVQLSGGEQVVELRRGPADHVRCDRNQATVDRGVDRITIDPGNPTDPEPAHAACTTGAEAAAAKLSGRLSKSSRTLWYRLSRSTGRFPAPRISRTRSL